MWPQLLCLLLLPALLVLGCAASSSDDDNQGSSANNSSTTTISDSTSVQDSVPFVRIETADRNALFIEVEISDSPAEQEQGLMFRSSLSEFAGMLFVFQGEAIRLFTMENTLIPLDMIHIDSNLRVVGIVENAVPDTAGPYSVDSPAEYVLEVNGGFAQRQGISIGDRISFVGL